MMCVPVRRFAVFASTNNCFLDDAVAIDKEWPGRANPFCIPCFREIEDAVGLMILNLDPRASILDLWRFVREFQDFFLRES